MWSEMAATLPSPLVLRLLKLFVDVINLRLELLLPLLWREVREILCRRRLQTHRQTQTSTHVMVPNGSELTTRGHSCSTF